MTGTSELEKRKEVEVLEAEEPRRIPRDRLVGEHLARAPPVTVSAQQEEIVVGEEEGPSEVVSMNKQMEEPGEKVVRPPFKQKH